MLSPHPGFADRNSIARIKKTGPRRPRLGQHGDSLFKRFLFCSFLILGALALVSFFASTSAQLRESSFVLNAAVGSSTLSSFLPPAVEAIETQVSGCGSAQTNFELGDTICAEVTGAPLPFFGFRQRRFQWVAPDGSVVQQTEITSDPQTDTFTVPNSGNLAQIGTWNVRIIRNNGSTVTFARFVLRDPANFRVDLSAGKFGPLEVKSGNNVSYSISVGNRGPDDAANVEFTDTVPANMTFVSGTQTSGPTFTCSNPSAGGTGTTTCTITSLPTDSTATFTYVYEVTAGTPVGTSIDNTVAVTSDTVELRPADNSATAPVTVTGVGAGGEECVITCPSDISVVAVPNASGAIINYPDPVANGASCGAVSCSQPSGTFFAVGTTVVVCAGETGDSCSFNVTVQDNQDPTISCPSNITVSEDPPGSGGAIVDYPDPIAADNSGVVDVTCTHPSGANFPVGTTTVTCTAADEANNTASCSFTITVTGNGCELECPDDIVVDAASGACNAVVTFPDPSASTECGTVTTSHASGSTFPVGTTTVVVSTTAGQSCSFDITVRDVDAPILTACPASVTVDAAAGSCTANVVLPGPPPTATDGCSTATVTGARSDGEPLADPVYPVGTTTITWTATDASGNTASCEQTVSVRDQIPPSVSINVPPAVATVNADANCQALVPDISEFVIASDNCTPAGALTVTQSPVADTVVAAGVHTITITVIEGDPDGVHNTTTATTTFTVLDVTPPVLTVNGADPLVVECHTSLVDPGATATDDCVANPAVTSTNNVDVNVPGTYTITYSTTDGTNTVTATRTVNVVDTTAPTITMTGLQIILWPPNHSYQTINLTQLVESASDGCDGGLDINDVVISMVTSDETENGGGDGNTFNDIIIATDCKSVQLRKERNGGGNGRVYTIHFEVTDASGNVTTSTAQVKVPKNQGANGAAVDDGPNYTVNGNCP